MADAVWVISLLMFKFHFPLQTYVYRDPPKDEKSEQSIVTEISAAAQRKNKSGKDAMGTCTTATNADIDFVVKSKSKLLTVPEE